MADCLPYKDIAYYSNLIGDYLDQKDSLEFAYHRFPSLENLKRQFAEKGKQFSPQMRNTLVEALQNQYRTVETTVQTDYNLKILAKANTFTITTGHQLNLFTGPLYFFYKIISVIKLTQELKQTYPEYNFVPVFWMASEDHDFEEISFFNAKGKRFWWNTQQTGAVGRFSTQGLDEVFKAFKNELNTSENAKELISLFEKAYLQHDTLSQATQYLANSFFGKYGLVIVGGDDPILKKEFAPYVKSELLHQIAYKKVRDSADKLNKLGYKTQVNPREINLFHLSKGKRERIIKEEESYFLHDTKKQFTEQEILAELRHHPEHFSPNAIMRPLYQEVILPNLCYVGGSGELAYWLELKAYFKAEKVTFPSLLMRNSALLRSNKQEKKAQKLNLSNQDLFLKKSKLTEKHAKAISSISIDFSPQKKQLEQQFNALYKLAEKTDHSFIGAVAAQEKKQLNGLEHLEKRLLKAQKRKLKDELDRVCVLQKELFPNNNLQERAINFSEFYEVYGKELLPVLFQNLHPLKMCFNIITL